MSARLALAFVAVTSALSIGCGGTRDRTEVSITDLVMKVESNGSIHTGAFHLHVAQPASATGSSGIRLHTLEIRRGSARTGAGLPVMRIRTEPQGDVEPGAESVSTVPFDLFGESAFVDPTFDSCAEPSGFFLSGTYFDEAEGAFFTVVSPPSWISPRSFPGTTWAETFGDVAPQIEHDAAVFADGSSIIVGSTSDASGPDGEIPSAPHIPTPFVMKLDAAGNTVWERRMPLSTGSGVPDESQGPSLVATSPGGGVVVAGAFDGTLDLGSGAITSVGDTDVFFARLDATGKTIETRRFGDALAQTVAAMDVDAAGNVVLAGTLAGGMDFGAGAIGPIIDPTVTSYYVARIPEVGAPIYAKVPVALAMPVNFVAAVGAEGTVALGGTFSGKAWVGAEPPHTATDKSGFLLELAADGSIAWSAVIDDARVAQVAHDQGDVVAAVLIHDKTVVGGGELSSDGQPKLVLARFDPAGALRYAIPLGGEGALNVASLVIDSAGHSLLSGGLFGPLSLPGSTVDPAGRASTFFAEVDRSGVHVRSMIFGCASSPIDLAVSHSGSRDVLLASTFVGAVDFGKGQIPSKGASDIVVAKLPAQ